MPYSEVRAVVASNAESRLGASVDFGVGSYGLVWGAALHTAVLQFRLTASVTNGFGGTVPYSSTPLRPNSKVLTLGLTYDL